MKRLGKELALACAISTAMYAQVSGAPSGGVISESKSSLQNQAFLQRQALAKTNEAEHQRELDDLNLSKTRPGVSGATTDTNPANYDELRAEITDVTSLTRLPAVLKFANGEPVRTPKDWARRRSELLNLFDRVEYGKTPAATPTVTWQVVSIADEVRSVPVDDGVKQVAVRVSQIVGTLVSREPSPVHVSIDLKLVTPTGIVRRVPVVMEFHWVLPATLVSRLPKEAGAAWQDQVLARGWAYAEYSPYSVQPDSATGLTSGVIGMVNRGKTRSLDDWGALKAWSWGASRALDYLATRPDVDAKRVAIEGHSRFGKAALVAMAYDPRFAIAFVSSSGAGGANLWRRNFGEQLENVESGSEFHWMAGNFLKYAADPLHAEDLPLDQHELLALCAPRPVFVSAGSAGDMWQDPHGMFLSALAASPVYVLLGRKGLADTAGPVTKYPSVTDSVVSGDLAYRQHTSGHTPTPNWPTFLQFAERYLVPQGSERQRKRTPRASEQAAQ